MRTQARSLTIVAALTSVLVGLVAPSSGCSTDPCVRVCEARRDAGCVVLAAVQLPCSDECDSSRESAEQLGCGDELSALHLCADETPEVCAGELGDRCDPQVEALQQCTSAAFE